jgi:hypothetical protein
MCIWFGLVWAVVCIELVNRRVWIPDYKVLAPAWCAFVKNGRQRLAAWRCLAGWLSQRLAGIFVFVVAPRDLQRSELVKGCVSSRTADGVDRLGGWVYH